MAQLEIQNLTFSYPNTAPCLNGINLKIEKGEFVVLCGKSGSGKTTLLRHLKSVLTPHGKVQGCVLLDGTPLSQIPNREQAAKIGFVLQSPDDQIVTDKVWHELSFGLESLGCDPGQMRLRVAEMANFFGIQTWFHQDTTHLSGGQKQMLCLASVMVLQPEILVLDEPTAQLDPIAAAEFLSTIQRIHRELGTTILLTGHKLEEVYALADRVAVLDGGSLLCYDTPQAVAAQLYGQSHPLFSALPTPTRVFYPLQNSTVPPLTVNEGRAWLHTLFEAKAPRVTKLPDRCAPTDKNPALKIQNLWFRYEAGSADVLRELSLSLPKGCIYALVGGNGTGKSTLLKAICGIGKPYRGKIEIFGKPLGKWKPGELFHGGIALLPQEPKALFAKNTLQEELSEMTDDSSAIAQTAALCEITHLLDKHPWDLSGGEQQRCALAKVLLTQPKILLLDEPTKGMDSGFKAQFGAFLQQLKHRGVSILLVSHDTDFCGEWADWIGLFFDGQILSTQTPDKFFGSNRFYTTAASRMSRDIFLNAVTAEDVIALCRENQEGDL